MIERTQSERKDANVKDIQQMSMAQELLSELIGREVDEETLWLCGFSVVVQWLYYFHCGQVIRRLNPDRQFGPTEIQRLADHITRFSITALKGWKDTSVGFDNPSARYQVGHYK